MQGHAWRGPRHYTIGTLRSERARHAGAWSGGPACGDATAEVCVKPAAGRAAFSGIYRLLPGLPVVVVASGAGRADKPCCTTIRAASVRLRAWSF